MTSLRIHWCSPLDSGQHKACEKYDTGRLDFAGIVDFAQEAEALGIDSLLMGISYHMPDPLPMIGALVRENGSVKFILAYRPGLLHPTLFAQVVNTISWMADKRIALNIVAGISPDEQAFYGDFEDHDRRYARSCEFIDVLKRFWSGEQPLSHHGDFYRLKNAQLGLPYKDYERPRLYLSGGSAIARQVAISRSDCWLRYGDTPEGIAAASHDVLQAGCSVGIRMHVLARETRNEALAAVKGMMADPDQQHHEWVRQFVARCDSEAVKTSFRLAESASDDWLSPMLWSGAVPYRGGPALCVVGSYEDVANYLLEYKKVGVSEFIFSGWPTRDEMRRFCQHVLPRLRELEAALERQRESTR
ncbi:LLM class flavin-dependent oxidoreductase [Pseudomonas promysalinigenes]|uniref:LLM class flavin-dependent oxidoreductase n=1 Tax=Pseudomonas promysalinigenes TaxID=485898 RepID=A0ABY6AKG1_9PSED|nr:LLM class flavin-dependent oxidoreductase [Pseudomonas promysalinigenes]UXH38035.1 LLM class flavin-dependent oxidoreductase [Pseudomonas promysalinigenes]